MFSPRGKAHAWPFSYEWHGFPAKEKSQLEGGADKKRYKFMFLKKDINFKKISVSHAIINFLYFDIIFDETNWWFPPT